MCACRVNLYVCQCAALKVAWRRQRPKPAMPGGFQDVPCECVIHALCLPMRSLEYSVEEAEAQAACLAGQAGLAVRSSKWDQAEEVLGQALQVAEGVLML